MTREEAAAHLGMAVAEVTDVKNTRDGAVVSLHDGHRQLIDADGGVWWYGYTPGAKPGAGGPPNAGLPLWGAPAEAEPESEAEPKKTTGRK